MPEREVMTEAKHDIVTEGEPRTKPHGELGCHKGYKLLSTERPTVYCTCTLGDLARAMDADPLDSYKAERWERVCRSRKGSQ